MTYLISVFSIYTKFETLSLILGFMLIGTLLWYRQWERFALLAVASGILLFFLWIGVFMEVILESAQHKIGKWIIQI